VTLREGDGDRGDYGAIADSVNFTIDELRTLIARINAAAAQVTTPQSRTADLGAAAAAAEKQSVEIRQTSASVSAWQRP